MREIQKCRKNRKNAERKMRESYIFRQKITKKSTFPSHRAREQCEKNSVPGRKTQKNTLFARAARGQKIRKKHILLAENYKNSHAKRAKRIWGPFPTPNSSENLINPAFPRARWRTSGGVDKKVQCTSPSVPVRWPQAAPPHTRETGRKHSPAKLNMCAQQPTAHARTNSVSVRFRTVSPITAALSVTSRRMDSAGHSVDRHQSRICFVSVSAVSTPVGKSVVAYNVFVAFATKSTSGDLPRRSVLSSNMSAQKKKIHAHLCPRTPSAIPPTF